MQIVNSYNIGTITGYGSSIISGIIASSMMKVTIENCYNKGLLNGSANIVSGIYGSPQQQGDLKITNCYNFGEIEVEAAQIGGIVGYLIVGDGQSCVINNCANFGEITQTSGEGTVVGGIFSIIEIQGQTSTVNIKNCYVDCEININNMAMVGGLGIPAGDYSTYSNVSLNACATNILLNAEEGMVIAQGALFAQIEGSSLPLTNSYGLINAELTITDETSGMDGNFAYLENFNGGRPVPVGLYYILDYGITTGIVDQINSLQI